MSFFTAISGALALAPFLGADNTAAEDAVVADFDTDLDAGTLLIAGAAAGRTIPFAFFTSADLDATTDLVAADFAEDLDAMVLEETAGLEETLPFSFEDVLATRNPSR
jgi:nucleoside 2-deoxyribosyltransferase